MRRNTRAKGPRAAATMTAAGRLGRLAALLLLPALARGWDWSTSVESRIEANGDRPEAYAVLPGGTIDWSIFDTIIGSGVRPVLKSTFGSAFTYDVGDGIVSHSEAPTGVPTVEPTQPTP